jgi:hypothetical protein
MQQVWSRWSALSIPTSRCFFEVGIGKDQRRNIASTVRWHCAASGANRAGHGADLGRPSESRQWRNDNACSPDLDDVLAR